MKNEESLRLFLGLPIEPQDGDEFKDRFLQASPGPHSDFRWEEASKYHLTIRFIPQFAKAAIPELIQAIASFELPKTNLHILQVCDFPRGGDPFLAAFVRLSKELAEIFQTVSSVLANFGLPPENHPFRPHITLAKIKKNQGRAPLPKVLIKNYEIQVDKLNLYQSDLDSHGSQYTILETFNLNNNSNSK